MRNTSIVLVLLALTLPTAVRAQSSDTYLDPGAADLVARARSFRDAADSTILSYTGTVRTRIAAGLRMPLKDRTLYRRESAARIRWSRDAPSIVKMLALREQTPAGVNEDDASPSVDELFDPTEDRIYFGLTDGDRHSDDDIWIEHPLVAGAEQHYRYQSGDTIQVRLQGGRVIRAIELRVLPRASSGHLVTGSLWIDPSNGTVVQAVYRLAKPLDIETEVLDEDDREDMDKIPGMFKPMTFDISLVAIEYSLYDFKYWMPRYTRLEGSLRAGVIRTPASYEISYEIDDVVTASPATVAAEPAIVDSVANAWAGDGYYPSVVNQNHHAARVLLPRDLSTLQSSPELPPPIWKTDAAFITEHELDEFADRLEDMLPPTPAGAARPEVAWGFGGNGLVRYNRIEGLSVGASAVSHLPYATLRGTARIGVADLHPGIELSAERATASRTVSLELRHALAMMDDRTDAFGLGNSASALFLGRDDGEYYRTTGARLTFAPPIDSRASYRIALFAQHDAAVKRETNITLQRAWNGDFRFRQNVPAAATDLAGATLTLQPWWGTDPFRPQAGLDMMLEGATGGFQFARARLTARTAVPLGERYRVGMEVGGGTSEGDVPPQRMWYLGGAGTLRGYDGSTLIGTSFARARIDLVRTFGWGGITVFSDAGWAGDRDQFEQDDVLYSAGVGTTLLDGLLRVDLAHALNSPALRQLNRPDRWRIELYLDALL
jgi:hypothetical protein